jgi:hypothetical protein
MGPPESPAQAFLGLNALEQAQTTTIQMHPGRQFVPYLAVATGANFRCPVNLCVEFVAVIPIANQKLNLT